MPIDTQPLPTPPVAPARPTVLSAHGDERVDEYYWLRQREDPEVTAYLEAENAYTEAAMAHTAALQEKLFEEFKARIQETDRSVPARKGPYWYYSRTVEGLQYPIHCRKRGSLEAPEEVLLDVNRLAEGHEFFTLGVFAVSPDHRLLAYSSDTEGSEQYTLRVRDLDAGEDLPDAIPNTYYSAAWANDNQHLFYTVLDEAHRPWCLYRHRLGTPPEEDVLVYQEDDPAYYLSVFRSKSDRFLVLFLKSMVTTEAWVLEADDPTGAFRVVRPREQGVEYQVRHHGERFFIVTNDGAENFKLMEAPVASPGKEHWRDSLPYDPEVKLEAIDVFAEHLALFERHAGLERIRVLRLADGAIHSIEHPEPVYSVGPGDNPEFDSHTLRFVYTSLVTPWSVYDYDMETRERELKKQEPVLGGFDPRNYRSERLWATAPDGVRVPISLVYRVGFRRDGNAPALLYGYGSYEASMDPTFSPFRLSLLDRGFVWAVAHVRGGGEMGRRWYEDGKFLHKRNTFTDFIACAEHLIREGYTSPQRLVIRGGSAGGLLMGAVVNLRPDLFRAVVAEVPFVDVLTTISDETLPLSVLEWEEWGDPRDPEFYHYMKSYSPYDNVAARAYPAMLVTAGLNDPRVSYWEPAKWVARLRARKTDANPLLLKTEMSQGHMGPSGRYESWREEAFVYAFILDAVGIRE